MRFEAAFKTDIGRKRQQNQDSGVALPELGLFVVADGMGGHRGGETASAMAAEIIPRTVREGQAQNSAWDPRAVIQRAIRDASSQIFDRSVKQPQLQGMGTTAVALLFKDDKLAIGHVGDSRCYYLTQGALWQLTRDHSLVQEKLRAGLITRDQLKTDRMKNVITRSVGFESQVEVDVYEMNVQPGDTFLLCSDGLSGLLDDPAILEQVEKGLFHEAGSIEKTVESLVDGANKNGGDDNITAIVVRVL